MSKKLIAAAADAGVTIRSIGQRNQHSVQFQYATGEISNPGALALSNTYASVEVYGIVGTDRPVN